MMPSSSNSSWLGCQQGQSKGVVLLKGMGRPVQIDIIRQSEKAEPSSDSGAAPSLELVCTAREFTFFETLVYIGSQVHIAKLHSVMLQMHAAVPARMQPAGFFLLEISQIQLKRLGTGRLRLALTQHSSKLGSYWLLPAMQAHSAVALYTLSPWLSAKAQFNCDDLAARILCALWQCTSNDNALQMRLTTRTLFQSWNRECLSCRLPELQASRYSACSHDAEEKFSMGSIVIHFLPKVHKNELPEDILGRLCKFREHKDWDSKDSTTNYSTNDKIYCLPATCYEQQVQCSCSTSKLASISTHSTQIASKANSCWRWIFVAVDFQQCAIQSSNFHAIAKILWSCSVNAEDLHHMYSMLYSKTYIIWLLTFSFTYITCYIAY